LQHFKQKVALSSYILFSSHISIIFFDIFLFHVLRSNVYVVTMCTPRTCYILNWQIFWDWKMTRFVLQLGTIWCDDKILHPYMIHEYVVTMCTPRTCCTENISDKKNHCKYRSKNSLMKMRLEYILCCRLVSSFGAFWLLVKISTLIQPI
jgi:hypothetical protein